MIQLLITYKYLVLVPLAIFEGPIITVICGFFVRTGFFNPFFVYTIMVIGDVIGDGLIYFMGYSGKRFLKFFKVKDAQLEKAKLYFKDNHKKALIMSKLFSFFTRHA